MTAISNGFSRAQFLRMVGGLAAGAGATGLLAACGDGGSGSSGGTASLTVVGVADEKDPLDLLTKAYTDSGAKVTFKTSYAPTDQVQTSVRTQLNGGNAPDIHVLYPGSGSAMSVADIGKNPGLLADLSSQSWTSLIPANLKSSFTANGKVNLFSAGLTVIGVIYNKSVFSAANVQIPTTYPELLAACAAFKKAGKIPFALGAQTPWVTQLITYAFVASDVYRDTPDFDDQMLAGKATFLGSGWKQAMTSYMDLRDQGFFNDNPNGTTLEQSTSMVATGQAAMAVQVAPLLPAFRDAAKNKDDISMFPFPSADTADKVYTWGAANVGIGVHEKSKNKAAALKFVEFLGQQENINKWCEAVAGIPIKRDASSKVDPALELFLPLLDAGRVAPVGGRWPNAEIQPTHFSVIQELLGKKITVDDALKKMDEVYKKSA